MWFTGTIDDDVSRYRGSLLVDERGLVDRIVVGDGPTDARTFGPNAVLSAGDFNAHAHPEQSIYVDLVDKSWDLPTWCRHTIYRHSVSMTPEAVRLACRRAFGRMALRGVTSVMVSFYLHGNKGNENDRAVIAAARDVGLRLVFGRMNYDIVTPDAYEGKKASQKSFYETPDEAASRVRELMAEEDDLVTVCPALHSFHADTEAALVAGIRLGAELNRPVQLHLSEDQGDVALSQELFGARPLIHLARLAERCEIPGLDGLIFSDCCWLDDDERAILSGCGARVVLNARMNDRVKAGFPDLPKLLAAGVTPWLGTDGEASNDDLSVSGERAFLSRRYAGLIRPGTIDRLGRAPFGCGAGTVGTLRVGGWADFKVTCGDRLEALYVGGRPVVESGRLARLDMDADVERPLAEQVARLKADER